MTLLPPEGSPPPLPQGHPPEPQQPYGQPPPLAYATPIPYQAYQAAWREGPVLIVRKQAALPDRCVKCNADTANVAGSRRLTQKLAWHHPALFLLIPLGLLVYAIVAIIVQQKATVELSLCALHNRARRRAILLTWLVMLLGLAMIVGGCAFSGWAGHNDMWPAWVILGGLFVLLVGGIIGVVGARTLTPKRMEGEYAWLKGAGDDFLANFPAVQRG